MIVKKLITKTSKLLILFTLMITLVSCNKNMVQPEKQTYQQFSQQISEYTGNYYTEDQLKSMYNNSNLVGMIILRKEYRNDYVLSGKDDDFLYHPFDGYETDASGIFFEPNSYDKIHLNSFVINAMQMREFQIGYYTPYHEIDIFTGNTYNKWVIESDNNSIPNSIDSVLLSDEIKIMNFHRGDTLNVSDTTGDKGYQLNWIGGDPNSKVKISIEKTSTMLDTLTQKTYTGYSFIIDNNHSYYFYNRFFDGLYLEGYYNLTVTSYEPHIKNLSNGKQILVVGMLQHTISVYLKPVPKT